MLVFRISRDEFVQEGPSGPIEAKRVLLLKVLNGQRTRVTFEPLLRDRAAAEALGFCNTPPLLVDHRPGAPGGAPPGGAAAAAQDAGSADGGGRGDGAAPGGTSLHNHGGVAVS